LSSASTEQSAVTTLSSSLSGSPMWPTPGSCPFTPTRRATLSDVRPEPSALRRDALALLPDVRDRLAPGAAVPGSTRPARPWLEAPTTTSVALRRIVHGGLPHACR
jgi:hypothetical protein